MDNGWPIPINGDCEGDGEPEILCEACGEEGYACCCGTYPPDWARFVCRYCGEDCGEAGCHTVTDPDQLPEVSRG